MMASAQEGLFPDLSITINRYSRRSCNALGKVAKVGDLWMKVTIKIVLTWNNPCGIFGLKAKFRVLCYGLDALLMAE